MLRFLPFLLAWGLLVPAAYAQPQPPPGDLTQDLEFFQQQSQLYQRWLDHSGLGSVLRVREISVKADHLSLYLEMPFRQVDSVVVAWDSLKHRFERNHSITLEQQLFYKLVHLMELRQSMADVQIYDTYDLKQEPLFMRAIYFAEGQVKVERSSPRSKTRHIVLKPDPNGGKSASVMAFQQTCSQAVLFEQVLAYAEARYEASPCKGTTPTMTVLESENVLRFEVTNLCREVLIDEAQPTLCSVLQTFGYPCDWAKRELLTFTVACRPIHEGVELSIEIDGKYGSGLYERVRRGAYLSMELDFDDYLERYADTFRESLKRNLSCR